MQWSPDNKIVPCLAEKWDVSPDGLTYTFHLRPNVKFQDGCPVTASDVLYSMRRCLDPEARLAGRAELSRRHSGAKELNAGKATELSGVKVVDPQTVAITITKPKPTGLTR